MNNTNEQQSRLVDEAPPKPPKMSDAEFYARGIARSRYHDKLFAEGRPRPTNEQFDKGWAAAMAFAAQSPVSVDEVARKAAEKWFAGLEEPFDHPRHKRSLDEAKTRLAEVIATAMKGEK